MSPHPERGTHLTLNYSLGSEWTWEWDIPEKAGFVITTGTEEFLHHSGSRLLSYWGPSLSAMYTLPRSGKPFLATTEDTKVLYAAELLSFRLGHLFQQELVVSSSRHRMAELSG